MRHNFNDWVMIESPGDLPESYGHYDFATAHKIYYNGYFGSSRYNEGEWYVREEDEKPPFMGVEDVTHYRVVQEEQNPNTN